MTLETHPLGQTGLEVSRLGLGTVKFGRNQEVRYPNSFVLPSDQEIIDLLELAHSLGINLLDTAPAYGSSEQRIGRLLSNRADWVICTKVGEEFLHGKSFFDFSADHVHYSIERSLHNLNTDYLDIVLIHSDGNDMHILESTGCLNALLSLKRQGVVRAVGMSTKTVEGGMKAAEIGDVVMVTYNPSSKEDHTVIDLTMELEKGVFVKKVLNSGHDCIGAETNSTNNLRFALDHQGVTSVIVGTINPNHLKANATVVKSLEV